MRFLRSQHCGYSTNNFIRIFKFQYKLSWQIHVLKCFARFFDRINNETINYNPGVEILITKL